MKTLLPFLLLGSLAVTAKAVEPDDQLPPTPQGKSFKLVWHDEFEGDKLDESKWTYRPDGKRKGGWWSRKAISLDGDGHLVLGPGTSLMPSCRTSSWSIMCESTIW